MVATGSGGSRVCSARRGLCSRRGWLQRCNDREDRRWELASVSWHIGDDNFFTFGVDGEGGLKVFLYPPKQRCFDARSIKTTSF